MLVLAVDDDDVVDDDDPERLRLEYFFFLILDFLSSSLVEDVASLSVLVASRLAVALAEMP